MSTPHNSAKIGDFAKTVLMPGDPLRSEFIAKNFLSDAVMVNNVRGIQGYTGKYKGVHVSVMASGMGMPSMGIYSYELFNFYGVDNIMRIGSAGAISEKIKVRDIVIAEGACTTSSYASDFDLNGTFAPIASYKMLSCAVSLAEKMKLCYRVGNLLTSDVFYNEDSAKTVSSWSKMGVMAVEMETAALYMNAARLGKNALTICTVSDHLVTGEETTVDERQNSFTEMIQLALECATELEK